MPKKLDPLTGKGAGLSQLTIFGLSLESGSSTIRTTMVIGPILTSRLEPPPSSTLSLRVFLELTRQGIQSQGLVFGRAGLGAGHACTILTQVRFGPPGPESIVRLGAEQLITGSPTRGACWQADLSQEPPLLSA